MDRSQSSADFIYVFIYVFIYLLWTWLKAYSLIYDPKNYLASHCIKDELSVTYDLGKNSIELSILSKFGKTFQFMLKVFPVLCTLSIGLRHTQIIKGDQCISPGISK